MTEPQACACHKKWTPRSVLTPLRSVSTLVPRLSRFWHIRVRFRPPVVKEDLTLRVRFRPPGRVRFRPPAPYHKHSSERARWKLLTDFVVATNRASMELDGNGKRSSSRVSFLLLPFSSLLPSQSRTSGGKPEMFHSVVIHLPTHARKPKQRLWRWKELFTIRYAFHNPTVWYPGWEKLKLICHYHCKIKVPLWQRTTQVIGWPDMTSTEILEERITC